MGRLARLTRTMSRFPKATAFAAGAVATLAMPPIFAWPVLFAVFPCLVWLLDSANSDQDSWRVTAWRGGILGWWFGFGYFFIGVYWISASLFVEADQFLWLLPFSATLIPAGLACFYAVCIAVASAFAWKPGLGRILALALALTVAEWLRGHLFTGLPWNMLGYALTAPPLLIQSAAFVGVYALTLPTVVIFAWPALSMHEPGGSARWSAWGPPVLALACLGLLGAWRLQGADPADVPGVRLRLVQPSIPQDVKWRSERRAEIFRGYLDLSRRNASGQVDDLAGITHVIWPESAIPFLLLSSAEALEAIAGTLPDGVRLITGAIRVDEADESATPPKPRRIFNSMLALDDRATLLGTYDKVHLVPFGEYLPFQRLLEAMGFEQLTRVRGGFASGERGGLTWAVPGLPPIRPLVCYESIFPDEVAASHSRPGLLLNVTNDGWFGRTAGPHQHLHQARVRAVEQGLPLVRVANTGISGVIDGKGRIVARMRLGVRGVIDATLPGALPPTVYARYGEWWLVVMLAIGTGTWWRAGRRAP